MNKVINLEDVKRQRNMMSVLDDEHLKIFRIIADIVLRANNKKHKQKIINNIYSVINFFEKRI